MRDIISRFAPAPTGLLHLGHVVNAIYVWGAARARGGRVLLRIEDHDRGRCRAEYETAILEDLAWLGFVADAPLVRQSERTAIYERALDTLRAQRLVYACTCSRADVARPFQGRDERGPERPALQQSELRYPGTCRDRGIAERSGIGLRVRLDPSVERFTDLRHGLQEQRPFEQCGDLLIRDRDGCWTYQFAVTVDDFAQHVTLVVRGDDLLDSTGRQLQLARLLGRAEPPRFLHHPLIMKTPAQKLSKSDRDTAVRSLRARGWTAERVIGEAAALAGLMPTATPLRASEVSTIMSSRFSAFSSQRSDS
jgi:glutamyl-tRNA synthetase/glutamyl-Q tRNA(Asp) synthetase